MPVHRLLEETLNAYNAAAGLQNGQFLFQSANSLGTAVTGRGLNRYNAWTAIRKRAKNPAGRCDAPMRRTCLKDGLSKPGCRLPIHRTRSGRPALRIFSKMAAPWKAVQRIAGHADSRTTHRRPRQSLLADGSRVILERFVARRARMNLGEFPDRVAHRRWPDSALFAGRPQHLLENMYVDQSIKLKSDLFEGSYMKETHAGIEMQTFFD